MKGANMLELLFGLHLGGWKAYVQFWFWTGLALIIVLRLMKKAHNGN